MANKTHYIPEGFHSITPYLTVQGADRLVEFLKKAFGAVEVSKHVDPNGRIAHGEFRIGDSMIELSEATEAWPATPCALHYYVPDTDATYTAALAAGATSLIEPNDAFYGDRAAGIRDCAGNNWYIATRVENLSKEELDRRAATAKSAS